MGQDVAARCGSSPRQDITPSATAMASGSALILADGLASPSRARVAPRLPDSPTPSGPRVAGAGDRRLHRLDRPRWRRRQCSSRRSSEETVRRATIREDPDRPRRRPAVATLRHPDLRPMTRSIQIRHPDCGSRGRRPLRATSAVQPSSRWTRSMGSYLLQELDRSGYCSQVGERDSRTTSGPIGADLPSPASFGPARSSTVLRIGGDDRRPISGEPWHEPCREIRVEHGGHGERHLRPC